MAFRARRGGFRRRGFRGRGLPVARKEPIWLTTSYAIQNGSGVTESRDLFQLVGPEDYTQDYLSDTQRKESCTIIRSVGNHFIQPSSSLSAANFSGVNWKCLLFIAGDEHVEDEFANDPAAFEIQDPATFVAFCREHDVMQTYPPRSFVFGQVGALQSEQWSRHSHEGIVTTEWDVTLKRKLKTDQAMWLLVHSISANSLAGENINTFHAVDSRVLIHD